MSAVMLFALLLQATAVVLLRHRLGKTWLRRPVTILVLASVMYQGVSPVLLSIPSIGQWDLYRQGVAQPYVDQAVLLTSAAMLAFTIAYLLSRPGRAQASEAGIPAVVRALDWRLLALCCTPLAVLTYEGRGYNNGALSAGAGAPGATVIASSFFVILMILAATSLVLHKGPRWFVPVLAVQSLLLAAAGERTPVLTGAVTLAVLASSCGLRVPRRQALAAVAVATLAVLAITGVRAQQGRAVYYEDSGLGTRLSALASGLSAATPQGQPGIITQAAVRLDGTSFAAAVLESEHLGQPRLPAGGVPESLLVAVPSAAWGSKLSRDLDPLLTEQDDFALPEVNFVPGVAGLYTGYLPWPWLIAFLAGLGVIAGRGERRLLRRLTPARLVLLAGAVLAAQQYGAGLPAMLVTMRAAAVLAVIVKAVMLCQSRANHGMLPRMRVPDVRLFDDGGDVYEPL